MKNRIQKCFILIMSFVILTQSFIMVKAVDNNGEFDKFKEYQISKLALSVNQDFTKCEELSDGATVGFYRTNAQSEAVIEAEEDGNKCMRITAKDAAASYQRLDMDLSGLVVISYSVKTKSITNLVQVGNILGLDKNGQTVEAISVSYGTTGNISLINNSLGLPMPVGEWVDICLVIDIENGIYDFYVNGKKEASEQPLRNQITNVNAFRVYVMGNGNTVYIDNIKAGSNPKWTSDTSVVPTQDINTDEPNLAYTKEMLSFTAKEKRQQREAGENLQLELTQAIAEGKEEFIIKSGYYRFGKGNVNTLAISNAKDMTIWAEEGTHLLQEKTNINLLKVENCKNLTIGGFTLDLDPISFTQGEVVAIDREKKTFDFVQDNGYKLLEGKSLKGLRVVFYNAAGTKMIPNAYNDTTESITELENGVLRVQLRDGLSLKQGVGLEVGCKAVLPFRGGENTLDSINNENCIFKDIEIYGAQGFGARERWGNGNTYDGLKITRRPGTNRLWAISCDGFHLNFGIKAPTLVNCEIAYCEDDLLNVHGKFDLVYDVIDKTHLYIVTTQDLDFDEGHKLNFFDIASMNELGGANVVSFSKVDDPRIARNGDLIHAELQKQLNIRTRPDIASNTTMYIVELDSPVDVQPYDLVECPVTGNPGAIIRDCYFHDGHVRGILFRSTDGVIENCKFEDINGPAILINSETYWLEGPFPENITIQNNDINRCCTGFTGFTGTPGAIAVFVGVSQNNRAKTYQTQVYDGITIQNNTIKNSGAGGILMMHSKNSKIIGNTIENPWSFILGKDYDRGYGGETLLKNPYSAIVLESNENVLTDNNTITLLPSGITEVIENAGKAAKK